MLVIGRYRLNSARICSKSQHQEPYLAYITRTAAKLLYDYWAEKQTAMKQWECWLNQ